jgi:hypothetical protein
MPGKGYQQPTQTRSTERLIARQARHTSGRVDWEDIDIARSAWGPFLADPRYLFDGDEEKGVNVALGVPPPVTIIFNKPLFIGHVQVITTDPSRFDTFLGAAVTWIAADGGAVAGVGTGPLPAPQGDRAHIAPPVWPTPMAGVRIQMAAGLGAASDVSEIIMENCICVNASVTVGPLMVDDTPEEPLFVQAQQQVVAEEVVITHSAGVVNEADILNKGPLSACTMAAGPPARTITVNLNHPLLINRVAISGGLDDISVVVNDINGVAHPVIPMQDSASGLDSDNFEPLMAVSVVITQDAASLGSTPNQLMILKVIEVKSHTALPELVEFAGQKVYWDQLNTNTAGAPALKPYMLTRIPLDINADDDPAVAGTLDATVVTTVAGAEDALITVQFHEYSRDVRKIRNYARTMVTVECGLNCRITRVGSRIGKRRVTNDTITWLTAEKLVTLNVDGAALRHVCLEHQDLVSGLVEGGWVLVWQVRVLGYRTAGAIAVPVTLWHSRGTTEAKLDAEIIVHGSEVYV